MKHFLLLAGLLLPGCVPTLAPHAPYLPALRAQGEAEARISTGLSLRKIELQVGYQATERLVLHAGAFHYGRSANSENFRSAELGAGYYYPSQNNYWRLGLSAGLAYGTGFSGPGFRDASPDPVRQYAVRYGYGYVQPAVLLIESNLTWGLGLRLGHAYYWQFDEVQLDSLGQRQLVARFAGRRATFVQPVLQVNCRPG